MKLFIKSSYFKKETWEKTKTLYEKLENIDGIECYLSKEENEIVFGGKKNELSPKLCDIIVSVGGDGTFLHTFPLALENDKCHVSFSPQTPLSLPERNAPWADPT